MYLYAVEYYLVAATWMIVENIRMKEARHTRPHVV